MSYAILLSPVLVLAGAFTVAAPQAEASAPPRTCFDVAATIVGTAGDDSVRGTPGDDVIVTGGGSDRVTAGRGDDLICAEDGRDVVFGGPGNDRVKTGPQEGDQMWGGPGDDRLFSEYTNRITRDPACAAFSGVNGRVQAALLDGTGRSRGEGNDRLQVRCIIGTPWSDRIKTSFDGQIAFGRGGNDLLVGGWDIERFSGGRGADQLFGGPGRDVLNGGPGRDLLRGQQEADTLRGGRDQDIIDGGEEPDLLLGSTSRSGAGDRSNHMDGGAGNDLLFGGDQADEIEGGTGDDTLHGRPGNDSMSGGAGADHLLSEEHGRQSWREELDGGPGDDVLEAHRLLVNWPVCASYTTSTDGIDADATSGLVTGDGEDTLIHIACIIGSHFDDRLIGGVDFAFFEGGGGADMISSSATNFVDASGGAGVDEIALGGQFALAHGGLGDDHIVTGDGDDALIGGPGSDLLESGAGNDFLESADENRFPNESDANSLRAGEGNDYIVGSRGPDTIDGGPGRDRISDSSTPGCRPSAPNVVTGGTGNDQILMGNGADAILAGPGRDVVEGCNGDDQVDGFTGDDRLFGNGGDDVLDGGDGVDEVTGGAHLIGDRCLNAEELTGCEFTV